MKKFFHNHDVKLTILAILCLVGFLFCSTATRAIWDGNVFELPYQTWEFMWISYYSFFSGSILTLGYVVLWVIGVITIGKDIAHNGRKE